MHFRRYGFIYILLVLFLASWFGQLQAMFDEPGPLKWPEFWAATFENWQSEFLQLLVQAVGMHVIAQFIFRKSEEEMNEVQRKLDTLLERQP